MKHRKIEYGLKPLGQDKWQWTIYPRIGHGVVCKEIKGSREQAEAECKKAIDEGLDGVTK
jgi:hypothetical protein